MIPYPLCNAPGARSVNRVAWLIRYGAPWPSKTRHNITLRLVIGELHKRKNTAGW